MSDRVSVGKKTLCFDDFQCCPITVINFDDIEEVDIIYLFIYNFMVPNTRNSQSLRCPDTVRIAR